MKHILRILPLAILTLFTPLILLAQEAVAAVAPATSGAMGFLAAIYAPLVNIATTALKTVVPKIPKIVLPLVNIGFGIGISYVGQLIGAPVLEAADPAVAGVAIGGTATVLYDAVHQVVKRKR